MRNVANAAKEHNYKIRGYISCVLGCPYSGKIKMQNIIKLVKILDSLGCYEISLGDTIGIGTAKEAITLVQAVKDELAIDKIAVHFHDTYGQALVNIYACLQEGIHIVDSSISGLGGCPYARGSSGNVATEDVVYMLNGMGIETGIKIEDLLEISNFVIKYLGHPARSKVALANLGKN
jgi:hydroxymethylglutaryl-CoA lyase